MHHQDIYIYIYVMHHHGSPPHFRRNQGSFGCSFGCSLPDVTIAIINRIWQVLRKPPPPSPSPSLPPALYRELLTVECFPPPPPPPPPGIVAEAHLLYAISHLKYLPVACFAPPPPFPLSPPAALSPSIAIDVRVGLSMSVYAMRIVKRMFILIRSTYTHTVYS